MQVALAGLGSIEKIMGNTIAATIGAIGFGILAMDPVTAADFPTTPPPQAQVQPPPPDYYANPPVEEHYVYPPPVAYGYALPPPTYEYRAPPIVVVPRHYPLVRHYGPFYEDRPHEARSFGPYAARGYARYDHQWGRGYRGW